MAETRGSLLTNLAGAARSGGSRGAGHIFRWRSGIWSLPLAGAPIDKDFALCGRRHGLRQFAPYAHSGLHHGQAPEGQQKLAEADALTPEVDAARARADVTPMGSCYCWEQ